MMKVFTSTAIHPIMGGYNDQPSNSNMYGGKKVNENAEERTQVRRVQAEGEHDVDSQSHQGVRQDGENNELESLGTGRADWTRDNADSPTRNQNLGGILSRLRRLQSAHRDYVRAHRQRLEARLDENKLHERQIEDDMAQLEKDILRLMHIESTGEEEDSDLAAGDEEEAVSGDRASEAGDEEVEEE